MRELTRREAEIIRVELMRFGVPSVHLEKLDMRSAMFYGRRCFRNPSAHYILLTREVL